MPVSDAAPFTIPVPGSPRSRKQLASQIKPEKRHNTLDAIPSRSLTKSVTSQRQAERIIELVPHRTSDRAEMKSTLTNVNTPPVPCTRGNRFPTAARVQHHDRELPPRNSRVCSAAAAAAAAKSGFTVAYSLTPMNKFALLYKSTSIYCSGTLPAIYRKGKHLVAKLGDGQIIVRGARRDRERDNAPVGAAAAAVVTFSSAK